MRRIKGFTLIELLVVISIIGLLIGILLPALGAARRTARQMQGSTQVRGIHQAMVLFAQGNKGFYPGKTDTGTQVMKATATNMSYAAAGENGHTVQGRFAMMIDPAENMVPAAMLISPSENGNKTKIDLAAATPLIGLTGYSYALLEIDAGAGDRDDEWTDTTNSQAIVVSDRLTNAGASAADDTDNDSIHSTAGWTGSAAYNDNHVVFESTSADLDLQYGTGQLKINDDLFDGATADDGWIVGGGINTTVN